MLKQVFPVMILLILAVSGPDSAVSQGLVRVYVEGSADGFSGPGAGDSARDLLHSLQKKDKRLIVVKSASEAEVLIQIRSRKRNEEVGGFVTYEKDRGDGKSRSTTVPTKKYTRVVFATLKVGSFETDLEGESITWRGAADKLAGHIDHWVRDNYARLLERRYENQSDARSERTTSKSDDTSESKSGTTSASIETGMSPDDVTDALGDPIKKVSFGAKSLWTYDGLEVIFIDGKVDDVKF